MGLDWLGEAMTEAQRRHVEEIAAEYIRVILKEGTCEKTWWVPSHNFMGVSFGAAGCLAIKLRDHFPDEAPRWIDTCAERISTWFDEGFDEQGAYFEGTTYANYGLTNAVLFAHALRRDGGQDLFDHSHLRQVSHFFTMSLLPGERVFDARNDAHYAGFGDPFMLRLATAHDSGLARWLHERCGSGFSPLQLLWDDNVPAKDPASAGLPLAEHYAGRGLCVFRTGWKKNDVMFATEAGPFYPVTHNQADKGHFTLYGLGHRWAIDSGYGNNRKPGGRDQTVAHNCVLIDSEGQAISGAGAGTNGRIVKYDGNQLEAEDGTITFPMQVVRAQEAATPRMKLFMHAAQPIRFAVDAYETHPRLKAATRAVKPEFVAVMLPLPADVPVPEVQFYAYRDGLKIVVEWATRTDEIAWPAEGDRVPNVRLQ